MRLFHSQSLESLTEKQSSPPFLTSRVKDAPMSLLNDVKEWKQRVPTPEKTAILQLASSFEKRRLGKQQQILAGIAQRCREQEVNDLSEIMSAKCDLVSPRRGARTTTGTEPTFYMTRPLNRDRMSEVMSDSLFYTGTTSMDGRQENFTEKPYKFFPARRIIRHHTKLGHLSGGYPSTLLHNHNKTRPSGLSLDDFKSLDPPQTSQKHHHLLGSSQRSTEKQPLNTLLEKNDTQIPSRLSYIQVGTNSYFSPDSAASLPSSHPNLVPPLPISNHSFTDSHIGYRHHLLGSFQHKHRVRVHDLNISAAKPEQRSPRKSSRDGCTPKIPSLESLGMAISQSIDSPTC